VTPARRKLTPTCRRTKTAAETVNAFEWTPVCGLSTPARRTASMRILYCVHSTRYSHIVLNIKINFL